MGGWGNGARELCRLGGVLKGWIEKVRLRDVRGEEGGREGGGERKGCTGVVMLEGFL